VAFLVELMIDIANYVSPIGGWKLDQQEGQTVAGASIESYDSYPVI